MAADEGHADVVQVLLEKGADISIPDWTGWTAMIRATRGGHLEVVRQLMGKELT